MDNIKIKLKTNVRNKELLKNIGFISEDILGYRFVDNSISIDISDGADKKTLEDKLRAYVNQFISSDAGECIYHYDDSTQHYYDNIYKAVNCIHCFGHGNVAFSGAAEFLFKFFDSKFERIALDFNAHPKIYPVLLPLNAYQKTGYLKRSPQYAMFCCNTFEDVEKLEVLSRDVENRNLKTQLKEPTFALSPSACFHTYLEYENTILDENSAFTFCQSVFRNEGRFNFSEIGRLMDYHVREIVLIGSDEYVLTVRQQILTLLVEFLNKLGLCYTVDVAADPFVMPKIQKFKKIQRSEEIKYEVKLNCSPKDRISVASFNLHGSAFTHPFNIKIADRNDTVTGCIGFGIERWVIAFICQCGFDPIQWPDEIKNAYYNRRK